jgi:hypothetical protein
MRTHIRALSLSVFFATALFGQGGRSTILGTVTDQTGVAVHKVEVTVTNSGTQQKRIATSTDRGDFEITALDVGVYDLQAVLPGFRVMVVKGINWMLISGHAPTHNRSSAS